MKRLLIILLLFVGITQAQEVKFVAEVQTYEAYIYLGGFEDINSVSFYCNSLPDYIKPIKVEKGDIINNGYFLDSVGKHKYLRVMFFGLAPIFNGQFAKVTFEVDLASELNKAIDLKSTQVTDLRKPYKLK